MMRSHFLLLALFAFFVSLVFSLLSKETAEQQLRFGAQLFAGFLAAALGLGWMMYLFAR
jgi:prepilin signal peptidase PulO-like enzyme (type II secretory pathway)